MHLSKRIISVLCVITIVISAISPAFAYSATDGFNPVSFWEYVYRGFGGGNRDGGFGGGGFGGSDPDSWTTSDDMKNSFSAVLIAALILMIARWKYSSFPYLALITVSVAYG